MKKQAFVRRYLQRKLVFILLIIITMMAGKGFSQDLDPSQVTSKAQRLEMWEEPRHQLVFSQDSLKIMDIRIPPGDTTEFHLHRNPVIYVFIDFASTGDQKYGGDWSPPSPMISPSQRAGARGYVHDSSKQYLEKESYHRVCNNDTVTYHIIGILSTKKPAEVASGTSQGFENNWFSVKKVVVEANQESEKLQFPNDVTVIQYLTGESDILENNIAYGTKTEAGAFSWHERNTAFTIRNKSEVTLGFVLVEIK